MRIIRFHGMLAVLAACLVILFGSQARVAADVLSQIDTAANEMTGEVLESSKVYALKDATMIVLPFSYTSTEEGASDKEVAAIVTIVQQMLTTSLVKAGSEHLAVIDPVVLEATLKYLKMDAKSLADPKNWATLNKILKVQYFLVGAINLVGSDNLGMNCRLVDTATGRAIAAGDTIFRPNAEQTPPAQ